MLLLLLFQWWWGELALNHTLWSRLQLQRLFLIYDTNQQIAYVIYHECVTNCTYLARILLATQQPPYGPLPRVDAILGEDRAATISITYYMGCLVLWYELGSHVPRLHSHWFTPWAISTLAHTSWLRLNSSVSDYIKEKGETKDKHLPYLLLLFSWRCGRLRFDEGH